MIARNQLGNTVVTLGEGTHFASVLKQLDGLPVAFTWFNGPTYDPVGDPEGTVIVHLNDMYGITSLMRIVDDYVRAYAAYILPKEPERAAVLLEQAESFIAAVKDYLPVEATDEEREASRKAIIESGR